MCSTAGERLWNLWGLQPSGNWELLDTRCAGTEPEAPAPQVTPGLVLQALREVGLPALETQIQPAEKTLVNFDTNFFVDPQPVSVDLTLLGQAVEVVATPRSYHWDFGDGSTRTTTGPGGRYPDMSVTYRYQRTADRVQPRVSVEYSARFRVAGGGWQDIAETVTIPGPPSSLAVAEAPAVLSGDHG